MEQLLIQLGINISSSAIYDFIKNHLSQNPKSTQSQLEKELGSFLHVKDSYIAAEKIINFLATNGYLKIEGSVVHGKEILIKGNFYFGNNSISETKSGSAILAGGGASISGTGTIYQDDNGNITISAGN